MQFSTLISLFAQFLAISGHSGYYWRDYSLKIPADAVSGGKDVNGKDTYIGQAYIHGHGIFVVQILPSLAQLDLACYGVKKTGPIVKILCSKDKGKFSWLKSTSKSFQLDTIGHHSVIGGFDQVDSAKGMLHVGRLMYQGSIRVGSISGYALENSLLHFVGGVNEQKATSYEVLLFDVDTEWANQNSSVSTY